MSSANQTFAPIDEEILRSISLFLNDLVKNTQLDRLFEQINIVDQSKPRKGEPWTAKHRRIYETLVAYQRAERSAKTTVAFLQALCHPAASTSAPAAHAALLDGLNEQLSFASLRINQGGKVVLGRKANTLTEAAEIADSMISELRRRHVHPEILKACDKELLQKNLFHGLLEANKSVAQRLRTATGVIGDGGPLADKVLGLGSGVPLIAMNSLRTETERSQHSGFHNLVKGCFGIWRNLTAHDLRNSTDLQRQQVLDAMTTISYIHNRLDDAIVTKDGSKVP